MGHITVWRFTKWLQDKFGAELWFQMTDDEKFLCKKNLSLENTKKFAYENVLDIIAIGFDPKKTHIIIIHKLNEIERRLRALESSREL